MATFVPFKTFLDTAFWREVNKKKLHDWKLDESPKEIYSQLSLYDTKGSECALSLSHDSFTSSLEASNGLSISGSLILYNTRESFKAAATTNSREELMELKTTKIWDAVQSRSWLQNPQLLNTFFIIAFADLKKFHYIYKTCVPALIFPKEIQQEIVPLTAYNANESNLFTHHEKTSSPVFLLSNVSNEILDLPQLENNNNPDEIIIVIADPCPVSSSAGWLVRNVLAAVAQLHPSWTYCNIISLRSAGSVGFKFSWVSSEGLQSGVPRSSGWEMHYSADLKKYFDPKIMMEESVDLNLKLIKWRLNPDLELERYSNLKVLILGAGTIGCNLARGIVPWGVRHISFVDNSTVSYSNPVRQSLSEFEDARLGRGKAETAVAALQRIFPSVQATAHRLTVPMPGHTIDEKEEEQLQKDIEKLEQLVKDHDVVFLALDSREARWLPTVLACKHRKMAISVAIGFDTYVIIRHGIGSRKDSVSDDSNSEAVPYSQLSCYFCSDVTAPGNSTSDRTLDQQCTVSRPGTSMIVSGLAVELLASVLQYPNPLETPASLDDNTTLLGAAPHQIRGFLNRFQQIHPIVKRFERCVACGDSIADQYQQNGWKFVRDVMNSPKRLEEVTGLDELQDSVDAIDIDFDDDESVVSN
ncbi:hypothetical protein GCK72_014048 [Caenorhabditis remanei]|uniref:Ubiquitin-like modifier-activating enzyme ATG7 n=1 Tax=Caenorhabditis remanei TaxID=31234 RepID=A0A6A5GT87_CAERE|nr:hypothetical protein GCK72_014048 [Caenorhabditis remanei]KAF1757592.1 hypothetical protein GCK72_014048 [Caenorhabditis remanei]